MILSILLDRCSDVIREMRVWDVCQRKEKLCDLYVAGKGELQSVHSHLPV